MSTPTHQEVHRTNPPSSTQHRCPLGGPSYEELYKRMSELPTPRLRQLAHNIARRPDRSVVDLRLFEAINAILEERRRARGDV